MYVICLSSIVFIYEFLPLIIVFPSPPMSAIISGLLCNGTVPYIISCQHHCLISDPTVSYRMLQFAS